MTVHLARPSSLRAAWWRGGWGRPAMRQGSSAQRQGIEVGQQGVAQHSPAAAHLHSTAAHLIDAQMILAQRIEAHSERVAAHAEVLRSVALRLDALDGHRGVEAPASKGTAPGGLHPVAVPAAQRVARGESESSRGGVEAAPAMPSGGLGVGVQPPCAATDSPPRIPTSIPRPLKRPNASAAGIQTPPPRARAAPRSRTGW